MLQNIKNYISKNSRTIFYVLMVFWILIANIIFFASAHDVEYEYIYEIYDVDEAIQEEVRLEREATNLQPLVENQLHNNNCLYEFNQMNYISEKCIDKYVFTENQNWFEYWLRMNALKSTYTQFNEDFVSDSNNLCYMSVNWDIYYQPKCLYNEQNYLRIYEKLKIEAHNKYNQNFQENCFKNWKNKFNLIYIWDKIYLEKTCS